MRRRGPSNDFLAVAAFAIAAAANQMLWLTFAPITTATAAHYGVSEDAVGWLSQIFPLLYVVLAIPAGLLLDRWFRSVLVGAAWLTAIGGGVRLAGDAYEFALAGQFLVAIAQPAILGAVTKLAAERVDTEHRTLAISIGSAGIFAGAVVALVLGGTVGARDELQPLLWIGAVFAVIAALLISMALRRPAAHELSVSAAIGLRDLARIYGDRTLARLAAIAFLGFGIFVAVTTWLQVLLEPAGIDETTASWILVTMTVAGVAGSILLPEPTAARKAERKLLLIAAPTGAAALAALLLVGPAWFAFAAMAVLGLLLLGTLPVILELVDRVADPAMAASAAGSIWLAGNLGGIVLAVVIQALTGTPELAFIALAALMLAITPIAARVSLARD